MLWPWGLARPASTTATPGSRKRRSTVRTGLSSITTRATTRIAKPEPDVAATRPASSRAMERSRAPVSSAATSPSPSWSETIEGSSPIQALAR